MTSGSIWRWDNVPLPEAHLAALGAAALLHAIVPLRLPLHRGAARALGWPPLALGVGMAGWAVQSASMAGISVDRPIALMSRGAYGVSRNPMYLGWSLGLAGAALVRRSAWLGLATAFAVARIHREILREELRLAREFGDEYDAYRDRVPRYLTPTNPRR